MRPPVAYAYAINVYEHAVCAEAGAQRVCESARKGPVTLPAVAHEDSIGPWHRLTISRCWRVFNLRARASASKANGLLLDEPALLAPRHLVGQGERCSRPPRSAASRASSPSGWTLPKRKAGAADRGSRKHWRCERLKLLTGWPEWPAELPEFQPARRRANGRLRAAGSASVGLDPTRRGLLAALEKQAPPAHARREPVRCASPLIEALVDVHGHCDDALRDAVLREISWPDRDVTLPPGAGSGLTGGRIRLPWSTSALDNPRYDFWAGNPRLSAHLSTPRSALGTYALRRNAFGDMSCGASLLRHVAGRQRVSSVLGSPDPAGPPGSAKRC